ncbi:hypothetical protein GF420_00730 [candidate division GN15 bacterium]|nr:hypothetical protein [candidate division GN15 bacterium]
MTASKVLHGGSRFWQKRVSEGGVSIHRFVRFPNKVLLSEPSVKQKLVRQTVESGVM